MAGMYAQFGALDVHFGALVVQLTTNQKTANHGRVALFFVFCFLFVQKSRWQCQNFPLELCFPWWILAVASLVVHTSVEYNQPNLASCA